MKTSDRGIEFIKLHEGFVAHAYKCPAGVWTIGYGHTNQVKKGDTINRAMGESYLRSDLNIAEKVVKTELPKLNQNQFDALVSFTFNVGVAAFKRSTLLRKAKLNPNDPDIAAEFRKWKHGGGKVLPGLITRREAELKLYFEK